LLLPQCIRPRISNLHSLAARLIPTGDVDDRIIGGLVGLIIGLPAGIGVAILAVALGSWSLLIAPAIVSFAVVASFSLFRRLVAAVLAWLLTDS
jgi:hypothetical protein